MPFVVVNVLFSVIVLAVASATPFAPSVFTAPVSSTAPAQVSAKLFAVIPADSVS